jgi:hypothetical protein
MTKHTNKPFKVQRTVKLQPTLASWNNRQSKQTNTKASITFASPQAMHHGT